MSLQFDGYLMSRDLPVAQFSRGECNPLREELLPLHFANHGTLEEWLQSAGRWTVTVEQTHGCCAGHCA